MTNVNGNPLWLTLRSGALYAVLHEAPGAARRDTSVILLPPFGWDEVCSYRPRRHWAIELARAGFTTARIDLPGTGDSVGGPHSPALMRQWLDAVIDAVSWLRETSGSPRIATIGIGLGGLLAVEALSAGAPIDDLILWAVPAHGRAYLRELKAHSRIVAAPFGDEENGPQPDDGTIALTGFALAPSTEDALREVHLNELNFPDLRGRAALLIGRGGQTDSTLSDVLEAAGMSVTGDIGRDYSALIPLPEEPRVPWSTITRSTRWLTQRSSLSPSSAMDDSIDRPHLGDPLTFEYDSLRVSESLLTYGGVAGRLVGVLSEPVDAARAPLCVVLLNVGPTRRTGPSRMWVEAGRRWAARGVPTVRMDLEGLGDSDGDWFAYADPAYTYSRLLKEQAIGLLDHLQEDGVADRFVFGGLCGSAYWAWQSAVADPRVAGAWLINQYAVEFTRRLMAERDRAATRQMFTGGVLQRLGTHGVTRLDIRRGITAFRPSLIWGVKEEQSQLGQIESSLETLRDRGTEVLLMLGLDEPLYGQLERLGFLSRLHEWPNLRLERLPSRDHNVRALWLQNLVHERLDAALDAMLTTV